MAEDFDPRFDPAFQPGYDPSRDGARRAPRSSREPEVAAPQAEIGSMAEAEGAPADPESEVEEPSAEPNPFERTLWIVAAALVIGGIAVTIWSNSVDYYASSSAYTWQQVLQQSAWALSTPMITIGFATGVGLLFRRAANWRPEE